MKQHRVARKMAINAVVMLLCFAVGTYASIYFTDHALATTVSTLSTGIGIAAAMACVSLPVYAELRYGIENESRAN